MIGKWSDEAEAETTFSPMFCGNQFQTCAVTGLRADEGRFK